MVQEITVDSTGETYVLRDGDDVYKVFTEEAGFSEGDQVEELVVEQIDSEFDYNSKKERYILRCYVYFEPLDAVQMGYVKDVNLDIQNWSRVENMVGDGQFCVVYERYIAD